MIGSNEQIAYFAPCLAWHSVEEMNLKQMEMEIISNYKANEKMSEAMQTEWRVHPRVQLFVRKIKFPFHN